jgi:hypothetical protein
VLPSAKPSFTDASGGFDLGPLSKGAYRIRVRSVGFALTVAPVVVPLADSNLVIVLPHAALALDTVHTTALEQQLPRLFERARNHLGAALYGAALDSVFARGGARDLTDMLTIDRRFASILRRPYCGGPAVFVDDVPLPGTLNIDMGMGHAGRRAGPLGELPLKLEMYISRKDIAAIEVFDSPAFVHEPRINPGDPSCSRIVLIWSKYYQQRP